MKNKHLIIGIDGATFRVINPWVTTGKLPHIGKLMKEGVYCNLRSTLPPVTGAAWSTFQTGVNPGKHGVFNWLSRDTRSYGVKVINSESIKEKTLWEIASYQGAKVGVIGIPVTYPPREVNGFMITGMLTPIGVNDYAFPKAIIQDIKKVVGAYIFAPDPLESKRNVAEWIAYLKDSIENREQITLHFLENYDWDLFTVHFFETDLVQHRLFHTLANKNNLHLKYSANGVDRPILDIYHRIDTAIGKIESHLDDEVNLILISDHGFAPVDYYFNINTWLMQEGYLKLKSNIPTLLKKFFFNLGFTQSNLYSLGRKIGLLSKNWAVDPKKAHDLLSRAFLSLYDVNWRKTKAYSRGDIVGQININLKGREPKGCVEVKDKRRVEEDIIDGLRSLRNPYDNSKVVDKIFRGEEVYSGNQIDKAPDIIFLTKNMKTTMSGLTSFTSRRPIEYCYFMSGGHAMNGIFIGKGKNLKHAPTTRISLQDMAPTILYSMGLKIPEWMDGEVVRDIFTPDFKEKTPEAFIKKSEIGSYKSKRDQTDEFEDKIKQRLKDLGYLD